MRLRFNLTAALAVAALAELVLHRLIERLFLPQQPSGVARVAADIGRFAFHLGGVLGLVVLVYALAVAVRRDQLFPRSMRFAVGIIALFFVTLAGIGVLFVPLPERFLIHLKTSHAFLAWFIVIAAWRGPGAVRGKVAVTLFALPAVLHALALFCDRAGWAQHIPAELARAAEICALLAGLLAPLLLRPDVLTRGQLAAGAAAGLGTIVALVVALATAFDQVQTLALYGFRLDLPPLATPGALTYAALVIGAFAGLAVCITWSLPGAGGGRLIAYGLLLTGAAGFQTLSPSQVLFATCGLLAMATGAGRLTPRETPRPAVAIAEAAG